MIQLDKYSSLLNSREYFDEFASQFGGTPVEKKLVNMAFFIELGGSLHRLINEYKWSKSIYIREAVRETLIFYIDFLREGEGTREICLLQDEIYLSESQLITILTHELSNRFTSSSKEVKIGGYDAEKYINVSASEEENMMRAILGDLYGRINLEREQKEVLIDENPWAELVWEIEGNLYKPLSNNVHPEDKESINQFNYSCRQEAEKYMLNILPEPFWGNVLDAKIIILTRNPGYVIEKNRDEYELLEEKEQIQLIKDQCNLMLLHGRELIPKNPVYNSISDYYWDKKTKELRKLYPNANSEIAVIQYIGYSSEKYKNFPKKISKNLENGLLPTQYFTVRVVRYLMQQNRVIVIARGETDWNRAIPELATYHNLVVLDNYNNTVLTPNNCKKSGKWYLIEEALNNNEMNINVKIEAKKITRSAKKIGDRHPTQPWVWTEYRPGKFDWRVDKKRKQENFQLRLPAQSHEIKSSSSEENVVCEYLDSIIINDIPSFRNWKEIFDFAHTLNMEKVTEKNTLDDEIIYLSSFFDKYSRIDCDSITRLRAILLFYITKYQLRREIIPEKTHLLFLSNIIQKIHNMIYEEYWDNR